MLTFRDSLFQRIIEIMPSLVVWFVMIAAVVVMGYIARWAGRRPVTALRHRRVTSAALVGLLEASEREGIPVGKMLERMVWLGNTPLKEGFMKWVLPCPRENQLARRWTAIQAWLSRVWPI